jgi:hypothetical protein
MKKIWSEKEINYLNKEFGKTPLSKIAENLDRSLASVKIKAKKLKLRVKKKMLANFYYSEKELLKEAKSRNIYLTRDILFGLRKNNVIETKKIDDEKSNSLIFYSEKDYNFVLELFSEYELVITLRKRINNKKFTEDMLNQKNINIKRIKGYSSLFIHRESSKFLENLFKNYITVNEFSKKVFYSVSNVNIFIKEKIITSVFFANKFWINKAFIDKIRFSYNPNFKK